jgi:purine-binding chemotaxis protein CheW
MSDKNSGGVDVAQQGVSLSEDDLYGEKDEALDIRQLVLFCMGDEWYGINVESVREVIPSSIVTPLPNVPHHILGIFSLRGSIISVTDLSVIFGLSASNMGERTKIVVIEGSGFVTGLMVDDAAGVVDIPIDRIEPPVSTLEGERAAAVEGQLDWDGRLIAVLNVDRIIETTRLGAVVPE